MASSLNHVTISGRLTANPESKGDGNVSAFSVAVNRSIRQDDGSWKEDVSFINCKAFNGIAKRVNDKLVKGDRVVVVGRLDQSRWEKEGQKRSAVEVIANQIESEGLFRKSDDAVQTTIEAGTEEGS